MHRQPVQHTRSGLTAQSRTCGLMDYQHEAKWLGFSGWLQNIAFAGIIPLSKI